MKREILCIPCSNRYKQRMGCVVMETDTGVRIVDLYPGEHVKFVLGTALNNYVCDNCGERILPGIECCAVSIWADYCGGPYYPWESDFIGEKQDD